MTKYDRISIKLLRCLAEAAVGRDTILLVPKPADIHVCNQIIERAQKAGGIMDWLGSEHPEYGRGFDLREFHQENVGYWVYAARKCDGPGYSVRIRRPDVVGRNKSDVMVLTHPELEFDEPCDICCGTKTLLTGEKCLCGDGTMFGAITAVRLDLHEATALLRKVNVWWHHHRAEEGPVVDGAGYTDFDAKPGFKILEYIMVSLKDFVEVRS